MRSVPGHHVQVLRALSGFLHDREIFTVANSMRMKRNHDLYDGGQLVLRKEANDYLRFVDGVIKKAKKFLKDNK